MKNRDDKVLINFDLLMSLAELIVILNENQGENNITIEDVIQSTIMFIQHTDYSTWKNLDTVYYLAQA